MGMARNGGAVALVTDGPVRDHAGICAVGLPVFCTGLTPNSPAGNGPGGIGGPVVLGGVQVETGDIVLGDRDGVVVVPFARIGATIAALARVRELEAALDAEVAKGLRAPPAVAALLASERCRRV
jgi:4-hydroxy-4-methyl-2-oxoglutarate aldolase